MSIKHSKVSTYPNNPARPNQVGGDDWNANHDLSALEAADIPNAVLGSGTADATTFLRGDRSWATAGGVHPDLAAHDTLGLATQAELDGHTGDTSDAHDASAISIVDTLGLIAATDVEAALAELAPRTGTFIPDFTFDTPGDLSIVYGSRAGRYILIGKWCFFTIIFATSTFIHGTASGNARVTGLPFTSIASNLPAGQASIRYTKANYTQVTAVVMASSNYMTLQALGSGQAVTALTAADFPSGTQLANSRIVGQYEIA